MSLVSAAHATLEAFEKRDKREGSIKKSVVGEERTRVSKNANAVSLESAMRLLNYMTQI